MYRIDLSHWERGADESAGKSIKFWLRDPKTGQWWLAKQPIIHRNGTVQTSDISEMVAARVAELLGIPTAEYRIAVYEQQNLVVSRNIRRPGVQLLEGWKWLRKHHSGLMPFAAHSTSATSDKQPAEYDVENLRTALAPLAAPQQAEAWAANGFDVFASYLMLDALISNTDRHASKTVL